MESPFQQAQGLLKYIGLFLSGVCHQFPEHSIALAGLHMPLCARCTGTYLGAWLAWLNLWLRGRSRAAWPPPVRVLFVLALFFGLWAVDGVNSYLSFLTGRSILYTPSNLLRLATGLLNGFALSLCVFPMFNFTVWREPRKVRVVSSLPELAGMLVPLGLLGILLSSNVAALRYPLVLLDVLAVVFLLGLVNSMIVMILLHRENRAEGWRQALLPLALGLVLAVAEVSAMAALRYVWAPRLAIL